MRRAIGYLGSAMLWVVVAVLLAIVVVPKFLDRIYYRGPVSGHFDGAHFANPDGIDDIIPPPGGTRRPPLNMIVRFLLGTDDRPAWPDRVNVVQSKPAARVEGERMVVTWVGHATFLIQTQGLNILTDPIWSKISGPWGFGPTRVAVPGIRFEDLPKIDAVVVSHNHYDHMDLATLKRLCDRDQPQVVVSLGNDRVIGDRCSRVTALDWGGNQPISDPRCPPKAPCIMAPAANIVVTRNHHWSTRFGTDRNRALWSSFTLVLPTGGNVFFAGDTGFGNGKWPGEAAKFGPIRLALIPIGAFRFGPGQMSSGSHIGPVQAAEVFSRLGAARGIGMHWGTFRLSYEAYDTPPKLLAQVMKCRGQKGFAAEAIGRPVEVPPYARPATAAPTGDIAACLTSPAVTGLP
jgi:L-ascorbate metabolism protein UlaG (beta-lactamase superfamily)